MNLPVPGNRELVVVSGLSSDSHTWNLVFLQLLIEELGHEVVNLGPCVPDGLLVSECRRLSPGLVVISSVNGHGYQDGMRLIERMRDSEELSGIPVVIGGKLGTGGRRNARYVDPLVAAGYTAVFEEGAAGLEEFRRFAGALPKRRAVS
ncbi:methylaspartate mutase sigma subunit [Streptomyces sp. yr375]|uniref:cobalamin B12-binding domain-containing protein n=1 Tax=Streptomyces sp. yr375 TaxID=1761906 RepID=UPI0008C2EE0F|nr:cobalamin-dependent protein [Streptomyces sp. yr375]SER47454.1 methylaspartate mutase sigma subunit [Streptomyces sp. yr375]